MSGRRHEPWRARFDDLKEAYALGALSEDERREFEDYLAAHPELQAEADNLDSVAGLLALAPQEYEPSPELRHNLFSRIEASGGIFPQDSLRRASSSRRGFFSSGRLAAAAVAAVAVLALVGLFAWNSSLRDANEDLRGELDNRQTYQLQGSGPAEDVQGEVVTVGDSRGVLVAENLPPTPEGEVYEVWLLHGGVPEPAGVFTSSDGGDAAAPIEGSLKGADAVAVTVEPAGGSPAPTSDILMTATL